MKKLIKNILRDSLLTEAKKTFFRRVTLPYDYKSMKDFVGYETMWEHYNKHYKGYTTKLNEALSKRKNPSKDIKKIIKGIKNYDTFTRNNAGGYYNHSLFFKDYITPDKTKLSDELKKKINKDFGSLDNFKRQFDEDSGKVFGSGWCWLVLIGSGWFSLFLKGFGWFWSVFGWFWRFLLMLVGWFLIGFGCFFLVLIGFRLF